MKTLIIIPTYNEKDNILPLIDEVLAVQSDLSILVVDDNSPDGTAVRVRSHKCFAENAEKAEGRRVHLLLREKKEGLGRAYLAGFSWALKNQFELIVEMDADFSHRPVDLVKLLEALKTKDFVVGSRYVAGGKVVNWGLGRQLISRGGGIYSTAILGYRLGDWTGGFNGWNRKVLEGIGLDQIESNGYSFQIELKYRACKKGFQYTEVPIVFEDRRVGQSKMSAGIFLEAIVRVWKLRWSV